MSATTHPIWLGAKLPGSKPTETARSHPVDLPGLLQPLLPAAPRAPACQQYTFFHLDTREVQMLPTINCSLLCPRCPNIFNYLVAYLIMLVNN